MSNVLHDLGAGLGQGFAMFWETLWALVLGFAISGAVQAFVSRGRMERALGRRSPAVLARATFLGTVSSSCSYAASAMAKSLFAKGADLTAAIVFMVASTNLVVELGVVLALLIGWQFTASEVVGGVLMVTLVAVFARVALPDHLVAGARDRLRRATEATPAASDDVADASARARMRTLAGWSDAASYMVADVTMLRRELLVGFGVAGFLAALVPDAVWTHLFVSGHGLLSSLENVAVGPLIAIVSFVCSIGNVPLAAALWKGGISFGGVVAFIFADLITLPLLLIYRRYYGAALTLRVLAMLWLAMSLSGLAVEYLFGALSLIPRRRPTAIATGAVSWNVTTVLDVIAIAVFAGLYLLHRRRVRLGSGTRHAIDPVCGMQVERATAPARRAVATGAVYFCSDHCAERFDRRATELPAASARR